MRYIRYAFLFSLAVVLLVIAVANRQPVELKLFPEEISTFVGASPAASVPLFAVIFGGIVAGVVIGFVWEWLREHKHRAEASTQRRERERLEREVRALKPGGGQPDDDVIALLETKKAAG